MKYTKQQIMLAMNNTGGIVNQILKNLAKLNVETQSYTRNALYDRIKKSKILKEAYKDEQERIGDIVESNFFIKLQEGEEWAMKEWFRYKGYTRGYSTSLDVTSQGKSINIIIDSAYAKEPRFRTDNNQTTTPD